MNARKKLYTEPGKALFYGALYVAKLRPRRRKVMRVEGDFGRPYLIWKIATLLNARLSSTAQTTVAHFDSTNVTRSAAREHWINGNCTDISKSRVAEAFFEVFGYDLAVDPRSYSGAVVEKSENNAAHDGRVLQAPIETCKDGYVYQRLIDNSVGDEVIDLRPCVIGNDIPFVYLKWRPKQTRFSNENTRIKAVKAKKVFSDEEIAGIIQLSRKLGLDFGELDVLRDKIDGRIYIVDVAKTPHSPGDKYLGIGGFMCMVRAARSFDRQFLA